MINIETPNRLKSIFVNQDSIITLFNIVFPVTLNKVLIITLRIDNLSNKESSGIVITDNTWLCYKGVVMLIRLNVRRRYLIWWEQEFCSFYQIKQSNNSSWASRYNWKFSIHKSLVFNRTLKVFQDSLTNKPSFIIVIVKPV